MQIEYEMVFLYPNTPSGLESKENILEKIKNKRILTLPCLETQKSVVQNFDTIIQLKPQTIILSEYFSDNILDVYKYNTEEDVEVAIFSKNLNILFFRNKVKNL